MRTETISAVDAARRRAPAAPQVAIGTEILLRRLRHLATLTEDETALIRSLGDHVRMHPTGSVIGSRAEGATPRLLVSGWASRPRILPDGRRQMLAVMVPGDLLGDRGECRPLTMTPAVALTPTTTINVSRLFDTIHAEPRHLAGLVAAMRRADRIEEAQLLDHVVRLGCQTATQRIAHCLVELHYRLAIIGFTHHDSFPMPLTQETMGELLGLSLVHVNRILSQLKRQGLVEIKAGTAHIRDLDHLKTIADFAAPTSRIGRA